MEEAANFFVDKWIKNEKIEERDPEALFISPKNEEGNEFNDLITNLLAERDDIEIIAADISKKKRFFKNMLNNPLLALGCQNRIFEDI